MISSLWRENVSLKLFEARAKMAKQESATQLEVNIEQLQKDRKVEVDSSAGQVKKLVERLETIVGDTVVKKKAKLMAEHKEGKVDHWCPDEAIAAWEELKALAVVEAGEAEPSVRDEALVSLIADDVQGE
ncbi:hypothetical protein ACOSQ3_016742 [Xanthoceras sorbifolium]